MDLRGTVSKMGGRRSQENKDMDREADVQSTVEGRCLEALHTALSRWRSDRRRA